MEEYKELFDIIQKFIKERVYKSLNEIKKYDRNWGAVEKNLAMNSLNYKNMIDTLDKKKQQISKSYINSLNDCHDYDIGFTYIKGYRDCMKLLFMLLGSSDDSNLLMDLYKENIDFK